MQSASVPVEPADLRAGPSSSGCHQDGPSKPTRGSMASMTSISSEPRPRVTRGRKSTSSADSDSSTDDQTVRLDDFCRAMGAVKPEWPKAFSENLFR
eukprot:1038406-Prymnesium_polylepis.1